MKYPNDTAQAYMRRCSLAHNVFNSHFNLVTCDMAKIEARVLAYFYGMGDTHGNTKQDITDKEQTWISDPA